MLCWTSTRSLSALPFSFLCFSYGAAHASDTHFGRSFLYGKLEGKQAFDPEVYYTQEGYDHGLRVVKKLRGQM